MTAKVARRAAASRPSKRDQPAPDYLSLRASVAAYLELHRSHVDPKKPAKTECGARVRENERSCSKAEDLIFWIQHDREQDHGIGAEWTTRR